MAPTNAVNNHFCIFPKRLFPGLVTAAVVLWFAAAAYGAPATTSEKVLEFEHDKLKRADCAIQRSFFEEYNCVEANYITGQGKAFCDFVLRQNDIDITVYGDGNGLQYRFDGPGGAGVPLFVRQTYDGLTVFRAQPPSWQPLNEDAALPAGWRITSKGAKLAIERLAEDPSRAASAATAALSARVSSSSSKTLPPPSSSASSASASAMAQWVERAVIAVKASRRWEAQLRNITIEFTSATKINMFSKYHDVRVNFLAKSTRYTVSRVL